MAPNAEIVDYGGAEDTDATSGNDYVLETGNAAYDEEINGQKYDQIKSGSFNAWRSLCWFSEAPEGTGYTYKEPVDVEFLVNAVPPEGETRREFKVKNELPDSGSENFIAPKVGLGAGLGPFSGTFAEIQFDDKSTGFQDDYNGDLHKTYWDLSVSNFPTSQESCFGVTYDIKLASGLDSQTAKVKNECQFGWNSFDSYGTSYYKQTDNAKWTSGYSII